ncbi:MAG: hypothetical protein ACI9FN_001165, partial [Saprospiraceae bacterium]
FETTALQTVGVSAYDTLRIGLREHIRKSGSVPWQE